MKATLDQILPYIHLFASKQKQSYNLLYKLNEFWDLDIPESALNEKFSEEFSALFQGQDFANLLIRVRAESSVCGFV